MDSEDRSGDPVPPSWQRRLTHGVVGWIGAFAVIGSTWKLFAAQDLVFVFASLGGSAVIVFAMPESPMAQPRSLFGGHAIASVVGLVFNATLGTNAWSIAIAMATAMVAMQLARAIHSPAGADPIIIMTTAVSPSMVVFNLGVGLALLWFVAIVLLNAAGINRYCARCYAPLASGARGLTRAVKRAGGARSR